MIYGLNKHEYFTENGMKDICTIVVWGPLVSYVDERAISYQLLLRPDMVQMLPMVKFALGDGSDDIAEGEMSWEDAVLEC